SERFQEEVLDLCVGCKGCASDCPTGVDMAKLKTEVKHRYHEREGISPRERVFGNVHRVSAIGSALAPLSNWAQSLPGADWLGERLLDIAPERDLPHFRRETLVDWFDERGSKVSAPEADRHVVLYPDTYTNYSYPEPGKAAVRVLEAAGVHVQVLDLGPTGRPAFSQGMLDAARDRARDTVDALAPRVDDGWEVVFIEPSDAVMLQDEYLDFFPEDEAAHQLAEHAYGVCEYLDVNRLDEAVDWDTPDEALAYHGHCNQQAVGRDHHAVGVLRRAGYAVDPLDSTCCGMAGSFGYEAEHYDLSKAIGRVLYDQVDDSDGDTVVAPGASCRTQLDDHVDDPPHPVEKLAGALGQ
ncbi:MAG: heterodisulfide reductase-related iron-sulfur binding cluster, partial [Halorientalis sp.]